MPNFVRMQNLVNFKRGVKTSVHLYLHRDTWETCTGMCREELLRGSAPLASQDWGGWRLPEKL